MNVLTNVNQKILRTLVHNNIYYSKIVCGVTASGIKTSEN